jgi:hypothetical protein
VGLLSGVLFRGRKKVSFKSLWAFLRFNHCNVSESGPAWIRKHHSVKLDPDPHQSEKQDPDPQQSEKAEALEGHFGALEVSNLGKSKLGSGSASE